MLKDLPSTFTVNRGKAFSNSFFDGTIHEKLLYAFVVKVHLYFNLLMK